MEILFNVINKSMKKKWRNSDFCRRKLPRMFIIMKTWFVLLFVCTMHLNASNLYSQQKKMDISMKNASLVDVFRYIRQNSDYTFVYDSDAVKQMKTVSLDMKNVAIEEILEQCFKGSPFVYLIEGNLVIVKEQKGKQEQVKSVRVKGFVYDTKKQSMPGVTVKVVGLPIGTATNEKGWFAIDLPLQKGALEFSFVGFEKKQVEFTAKTDTLRIVLKEDVSDLDEVVVRAYGSQKKREMISAISTVTAEEMKELPAASITSMLQGRLAGVNIIQQSGAPGSAAVIAVRGFNSLLVSGASDGQPLWVVDGVPMHSFVSPVTGTNTLADLDPSMIESVQVLKDAAAASIYGSRAGNGVILVTTKKGREGMAQFTGNVSYSISQLMEYPTQTGGRMERWLDVIKLRNTVRPSYNVRRQVYTYPTSYEDVWGKRSPASYDAFWGNGNANDTTLNYGLQDSLDPYYNNSQNWWKYVFNTGKVLNANIQASGGSQNFQYIVGAGFYDEDGIMINSGYSRFSLRSNLTSYLSKKLRLDTRIYLSYVDRTMSKSGNADSRYEGLDVVPEEQRTYIAANADLEEEWLKVVRGIKDRTDDYRLMASLFAEYEIVKGLTFSASGNVDYSQGNMNKFTPSNLDEIHHENKSEGAIGRVLSISTEELLHFNKKIKDTHSIDVLLGINANKEQEFNINGWGKGGASDYVYYFDPVRVPSVKDYDGNWESMTRYASEFTEKVMVSYFGRLGYNYKQRYLLEFTFRRDGSSTFGEGNRWANFPSVALGWTFSEEPFIKRLTGRWLNWGKIRGSYGTSGQVFKFAYLAHGLLNIQKIFFQGNPGIETNVPVSPDLTWEKTEQYDLGVDMDMFDYRLNVKLDYYYKYTSSLIYDIPLPSSLYIRNIRTENAMAISNEGLELELQADILRENVLSWRMKFNIARNWNRFEKSYCGEDIGRFVIGRPLYGMYVAQNNGFYESEDEVPRYYNFNGEETFIGKVSVDNGVSGLVGSYNLTDLNGDNFIGDLYFAGSPLPLAHGGWVNELQWKNFDLNVLFNFSIGRKIINEKAGSLNVVGPKFVDYRDLHWWTDPGCDANMPKLGFDVKTNIDTNIEKVNAITLKQITLGYNAPKVWVRKVGLSGVRLFATIENLCYLSNYAGENPEVIDIYSGRDKGTQYPLPRKWTLGLTLNF